MLIKLDFPFLLSFGNTVFYLKMHRYLQDGMQQIYVYISIYGKSVFRFYRNTVLNAKKQSMVYVSK